jgi:hypothetical protein
MTTSFPLTVAPVPLPHAVIATLLGEHYPAKTSEAEHRKLVVLFVVRWWAFSWLGRRLGRAGVEALRDVFVSSDELTHAFLPLHRRIYAACLEILGFADARAVAAGPQAKELRIAARSALQGFGILLTPPMLATLTNLNTALPSSTRTVLLTPGDFFTLWDIAAPILFGTISPVLGESPPLPTSFKRRILASSASSTSARSDSSSSSAIPTEGTGPLQRLALALADLRASLSGPMSLSVAGAVFYVGGDSFVATRDPLDASLAASETAPSAPENVQSTKPDSAKASTWLKPSKGPSKPATGVLSSEDAAIVRRAIHLLVLDDSPLPSKARLIDLLATAAGSNTDSAPTQAVYCAARAVLERASVPDVDVIATLCAPLRQAAIARAEKRTALDRLLARATNAHRRALLAARRARASYHDLRLRAWWTLEARQSATMATLRRDARDGSMEAPAEPSEGMLDFVRGDDGRLHRLLELVHGVIDQLLDPAKLAPSPYWQREAVFLRILEATPPSVTASTFTSLLSTPIAAFSFAATSPMDEHARNDFVVMSFGASTPSLAEVQGRTSPQAVIDLLDKARGQIAGYLLGDLQAEGLGPLSLPLLGADEWLRTPSTRSPDTAASSRLLRRFASHPSPTVKLAALHDLVRVVAISPPPAKVPLPSPGYFRRLSDALLPVSPTKASFDSAALATVPEASEAVGGADALLVSLERLLADDALRPANLFASLQVLAALVPSSILDATCVRRPGRVCQRTWMMRSTVKRARRSGMWPSQRSAGSVTPWPIGFTSRSIG